MRKVQFSLIITVFNEQSTILQFIESVFNQSKLPDEFIIVDGGSRDSTVAKIKSEKLKIKNYIEKFKIIVKKGNRSVGRNEAIKNASGEIILCSDAGCVLDKNWVKNISEPFSDQKVDVVAGYYKGKAKNIFQKCLIPYVLVMQDKINSKFLPATRSMAFKKSIWKKAGMFPEKFSNNEDYIFAKQLKKIKANILFEKKAIAYWLPRENIRDVFIMFYRFAKGDSESNIFRPKVAFIFVRYIVGILFLFYFLLFKSYIMLNTLYLILFLYILWAILKNYKYVKNWKALFYLPLMQFISDMAVLFGTVTGMFKMSSYSRN